MEKGRVLYSKNENLIILGAGGHGRVIRDIAVLTNHYKKILFCDDDMQKKDSYGDLYLGNITAANAFVGKADFVVAIGSNSIRCKLQTALVALNADIVTLIHPFTSIGSNVIFGRGTVMMAGAVANSGSSIGNGVILNTGCSVDHDNQIDDYAHISVGTHLAGTVTVGKYSFIGAGAVIINNISVAENTVVGAGAVVVSNIVKSGTYVGVPAVCMQRK